MGHMKMMAATQPFLSGAISKTVNLPQDCSVDDIAEAYMEAWRQGIKAVAIYRDNSKGTQPLNVKAQTDADKKGTKAVAAPPAVDAPVEGSASMAATPGISPEAAEALAAAAAAAAKTAAAAQIAALEAQIRNMTEASTQNADSVDAQAPPRAVRHRLPAERASVTHKFALAGHEGYITVGLYPNGSPGEIFIRMAKEGSTVSGLMDSVATAISISLQHGVPLRVLCEKFAHTRFEPSGWTGNPEIGYAKSIMDYIFRWIQIRFLSGTQLDLFAGLTPQAVVPVEGHVSAPGNTVNLAQPEEAKFPTMQSALASYAADVTPQAILEREQRAQRSLSDQDIFDNAPDDRTPPHHGIAPDLASRSGMPELKAESVQDRGIYHASDAMKSMYDMGDAPSCATCGAIMTRSGSCYRCMSCGSTSGCS
jgi:ribonucleoside-diphosphate reductase alpha chain